ncbi:MAG: hypothetical protein GY859_42275, partial [Desulfobacterales bacterium]|nr:hypothetical protein [Desulfobacterales bacterium]
MKKAWTLIFILVIGVSFCGAAYGGDAAKKETFTQVSTLGALLKSIFD